MKTREFTTSDLVGLGMGASHGKTVRNAYSARRAGRLVRAPWGNARNRRASA